MNTDDRALDGRGRPLGLFGADVATVPTCRAGSPPPNSAARASAAGAWSTSRTAFCAACAASARSMARGRCQPLPGQDRARADRFADGDYDPDTGECRSNLSGRNALFETYFPVGALDATRGIAKAPDAIIDTRSLPPERADPLHLRAADARARRAVSRRGAAVVPRVPAVPGARVRRLRARQAAAGRRPSGALISDRRSSGSRSSSSLVSVASLDEHGRALSAGTRPGRALCSRRRCCAVSTRAPRPSSRPPGGSALRARRRRLPRRRARRRVLRRRRGQRRAARGAARRRARRACCVSRAAATPSARRRLCPAACGARTRPRRAERARGDPDRRLSARGGAQRRGRRRRARARALRRIATRDLLAHARVRARPAGRRPRAAARCRAAGASIAPQPSRCSARAIAPDACSSRGRRAWSSSRPRTATACTCARTSRAATSSATTRCSRPHAAA